MSQENFMMSPENDPDSFQFWSSLLKSLADSDPIDHLFPEINSPVMVMATTMSVDVMPQPWNVIGDGSKEAVPEKAVAEGGTKNTNIEVGEKSTEKEKEKDKGKEPEVEPNEKTLGKRPRGNNETRNLAEKRRRDGIKDKIDTLKELTLITSKDDMATTLETIVVRIREMKLYVESRTHGPTLPLGMNMDFPAPYWFYSDTPDPMTPLFSGFTQGETSGYANNYDHQVDLINTYQDFDDQLQWTNPINPMY